MPIYMDVHIIPGVKAKGVAEAHKEDLQMQEAFGCKCMTYWVDEARESVFCLIEAPGVDAVVNMHNSAHGLIPHKVIEVSPSLVESFLGRLFDPSGAEVTEDGLKIFHDPSFRVLLVTHVKDPVLLQHELGKEQAARLVAQHNMAVRQQAIRYNGREVEHEGDGAIFSFSSASNAVQCALAIQKITDAENSRLLQFRTSISAGEPVEKSHKLFGDSIQRGRYLCLIGKMLQIALSSTVKELVAADHLENMGERLIAITPQDEEMLDALFMQLEENWQDPEFDVDDFCKAMAMSKSQLYRKTISLTGMSPNILLKEFRLEKAKSLMKKKPYNIAQVTFSSGFTSPSYFTKCFKKRYGILPASYLEMVQ